MTQYNTLNVKLSNSQLKKLKSGIKDGTQETLKCFGDFHDENNLPHQLLLTNRQILRLCKTFANGSLANVKLSKIQLHKIGHAEGFLGRLLGTLLKAGLPLLGNVL